MSFLDPILSGGPADALLTNVPAAPVNVSQSDPPNPGDVLKAVDGTHATWQPDTGGGGGDGDGFPLIPGTVGQPTAGHWAVVDSGAVEFPDALVHETRIGFFAVGPTTLTCLPGVNFIYRNGNYGGGDSVVIPALTYVEWSLTIDGETYLWIPRGMSNEAPGGGGGGSYTGLPYSGAENTLNLDTFTLATSGAITIPEATTTGKRVGVFSHGFETLVTTTAGQALYWATGLSDSVRLLTYSYAEWVSVDVGGEVVWIPAGAEGESDFPLIPNIIGTPSPNRWAIVEDGSVTFPVSPGRQTRFGFFTVTPTTLTCGSGVGFVYNGVPYDETASATIPPFTYVEWTYVESEGIGAPLWVPRGMSNEAPPSDGGGGWLTYNPSGPDMLDGRWVRANNNTTSAFPDSATEGMHVGLWVDPEADGGGSTVGSGTNIFFIDRKQYGTGETAPLRGGAWYEWVAISFGEDVRWIPVGGSANAAKPFLQKDSNPADPFPNQWTRASENQDVDGNGIIHMPESPQDGDVFGTFVDTFQANVYPRTGQDVLHPNGNDFAVYPGSFTVLATAYYEWIYSAFDSAWYPRTNSVTTQYIQNAITNGTLAIDMGDKPIVNVSDPINPQDVATKAWVESLLVALRAELLGGAE